MQRDFVGGPRRPVASGLFMVAALTLLSNVGCGTPMPHDVAEGIAQASSFTLYEGLPHQRWEADAMKEELATRETITLHGFPFYERPLSVTADDAKRLRELAISSGSFTAFSGAKTCGGFHPDYALAWKGGGSSYEVLICFGCHEALLIGPKNGLQVDISDVGMEQFRTILAKYRDQRPESAYTQN